MLENGIDVNAKDAYGYTALILAIQHNKEEIVNMLLKKGVHITEGIKKLLKQQMPRSIASMLVDAIMSVHEKKASKKSQKFVGKVELNKNDKEVIIQYLTTDPDERGVKTPAIKLFYAKLNDLIKYNESTIKTIPPKVLYDAWGTEPKKVNRANIPSSQLQPTTQTFMNELSNALNDAKNTQEEINDIVHSWINNAEEEIEIRIENLKIKLDELENKFDNKVGKFKSNAKSVNNELTAMAEQIQPLKETISQLRREEQHQKAESLTNKLNQLIKKYNELMKTEFLFGPGLPRTGTERQY